MTLGIVVFACPHTNLPIETDSGNTSLLSKLGAVCRTGWGLQIGVGAWAQDLTFSAKVDKTAVDLGDPIHLTLTLSGDLTGVEIPTLDFPEGFTVAARSQSTSFSMRAGVTERSMNLLYVLVPQREGAFTLGPFTVTHKKQAFQTAPIEMTVNKPALPPRLKSSPGERFSL